MMGYTTKALPNQDTINDGVEAVKDGYHSIADTLSNVAGKMKGTGKRVAAGAVIGLGALVGGAQADMTVPNPGYSMNDDMLVKWDYKEDSEGKLTGFAILDFMNIGGNDYYSEVEMKIPDLEQISLPTGWVFDYNPQTDVLSIIGQTDGLSLNENITAILQYGDDGLLLSDGYKLGWGKGNYYGGATAGNIDIVGVQKVNPIPEPSSLLLTAIGLSLAARKKKD